MCTNVYTVAHVHANASTTRTHAEVPAPARIDRHTCCHLQMFACLCHCGGHCGIRPAHASHTSAELRNQTTGVRAQRERETHTGCATLNGRAPRSKSHARGTGSRRRAPRSGRHERKSECPCPAFCRRPTRPRSCARARRWRALALNCCTGVQMTPLVKNCTHGQRAQKSTTHLLPSVSTNLPLPCILSPSHSPAYRPPSGHVNSRKLLDDAPAPSTSLPLRFLTIATSRAAAHRINSLRLLPRRFIAVGRGSYAQPPISRPQRAPSFQ